RELAEGETESRIVRGIADRRPGTAAELLEDQELVLGSNAVAGVDHAQRDLVRSRACGSVDLYLAAAAMTDGGDHQVREHPADEPAVGERRWQVATHGRTHRALALLRDGHAFLDDLIGHLGDGDRLAQDWHLPFLDLADLEEVLDEPHHLAAGPVDL